MSGGRFPGVIGVRTVSERVPFGGIPLGASAFPTMGVVVCVGELMAFVGEGSLVEVPLGSVLVVGTEDPSWVPVIQCTRTVPPPLRLGSIQTFVSEICQRGRRRGYNNRKVVAHKETA